MLHNALIEQYLAGAALLRDSVAGMTDQQLDATPIPGTWSTRQVVCHVADFETIYADRIKRVLAEDQPVLLGADPDTFAASLQYARRPVEDELQLVDVVRRQVATILRAADPEAWQRTGTHSEDGPLTVETLLRRITDHIPHHVGFIQEKRRAME